jgi:hypothetical protein
MSTRARSSRALALVAILTLVGTACGGGGAEQNTALVATEKNVAPSPTTAPIGPTIQSEPGVETEPPATQPEAAVTVPSDLPDIQLTNVVNNEQLSLASLVPSDRPLLLWFWAPH